MLRHNGIKKRRKKEKKRKKTNKNKRDAWKYARPETFCSRGKRRPERKYWQVLIRKVKILFAGENRVFHGKRRPPSRACPLFFPAGGNFFEKNSHGLRAPAKSRANKNTGGLTTTALRSGIVRLPLSFVFPFTFLSRRSVRFIDLLERRIFRDRGISRSAWKWHVKRTHFTWFW